MEAVLTRPCAQVWMKPPVKVFCGSLSSPRADLDLCSPSICHSYVSPSILLFLSPISLFFSLRSLCSSAVPPNPCLSTYDSVLLYLTSAWCSLPTSDLQMNYMLRSWSIRPSARSWTMPSTTWPLCSVWLPLSESLYIPPSSHSSSLSIPALSPPGFGFGLWSWNPGWVFLCILFSFSQLNICDFFCQKKKLLKIFFLFIFLVSGQTMLQLVSPCIECHYCCKRMTNGLLVAYRYALCTISFSRLSTICLLHGEIPAKS